MPRPLSQTQKTTLSKASRSATISAAARLAKYTQQARWLGSNNKYAVNTLDQIKQDFHKGAASSRQSKHAAELLAASAPSHCIDGWSYLGRALACHFCGDADSARHLGYYAELRAGAALLAGAGIGVLNDPHLVVDSSGQVQSVKGHGTHVMMWLGLEHWANSNDAAQVLGTSYTPASVPIATWVGKMPGGSAWKPIGKEWLLSLGLDLKYLAEDREARNHASYRPTHLPRASVSLGATASARFALELWGMLEPTAYRAFDRLDLHFLRRTIEMAFRSVRGSSSRQAPKLYREDISAVLRATVASGARADGLEDFLLRKREPDDANIILEARKNSQYRAPDHHVQVMSRAALLLRLATGATKALLDDAGIDFKDIGFWWEPIGRSRGFWEQAPEPVGLPDLWADIADALRLLEDWVDTPGSSQMGLRSECAGSLAVLGGAEIVGLWGLAS